MQRRLTGIREKLSKQRLDALFITNQHNVTYITGFSGLSPQEREGFLLVTRENAYLLTFPTYFGLYKQGGDGFTTLCITGEKRLTDHLSKICTEEKIQKIGVEKENLTLSEYASLKSKLSPLFVETEQVVETFRIIKDDTEITAIRKAAEVSDLAFTAIQKEIHEGVSERTLALHLEYFIKKSAQDIAFPPIVAFGKNAAIPHYLSQKDQRLKISSLVLLDFGAKVDGYCSDMTRVVFFGSPKESEVRVYETVLEAQKRALAILKVGIAANEADRLTRSYITSCGFPEYPHSLGHGVGLAIHEAPRLKTGNTDILKEGMVVTVEPGIYLEDTCGVRIEDLVVLRKDGIEILSKSSKELIIL